MDDPAATVKHEVVDAQARVESLLRHGVDAVITVALDGTVVHWNDAAQRMYGWRSDEMIGRPLACLLPADCPAEEGDVAARLETQGPGLVYETRRLHRDGSVLPVSVSIAPVLNAAGQIVGVTKIDRDLRPQVQVAAALAATQTRLRSLYEASPAMLFALDDQGRMLLVSDRWLQRFGLARDAVLGHLPADFMTPASRALPAVNQLPELLRNGRCDRVEYQMLTQGGEVVDVQLSAILERDSEGRPLRTMAIVEDVTAQHRAEQALRQERQRLANILDGTQAATWEWNVRTGQLRVNEQWARRIGHRLSDWPKVNLRLWQELTHPEDMQAVSTALERHLSGQAEVYECETRMRHRDGHWVWSYDRGRVLSRGDDGRPEWMYGTSLDVTERAAQHQAAEEARRRVALATESGGIGIWDWDIANAKLTWDAGMRRLYGVAPSAPAPTWERWRQMIHAEDWPLVESRLREALRSGAGSLRLEFRTVWPDASVHHLCSVSRVSRDGSARAVRMTGALWDLTAERTLAMKLAEQHELLNITLQSIGDAVITTDPQGFIRWLNPAAERMTGWASADARGRALAQVFHIVHEETRQPTENPVALCLQQGTMVGLASNTLLVSRSGEEFGIEDSAAPIRNAAGEVLGVVLVFRDVTEQRRLSGEMSWRASHDKLTGLVNRDEFEARLRRVLDKSHEERSTHALLYLNLDRFKLVNDACGHAVGDLLLAQVGALFTQAVRARDTLARLGGDEFAVILEHCPFSQAQRVAQQLCDRLEDFRFSHDGQRFSVGASIGLVPVDSRWASAAAIIKVAESACRAAKDAGRSRVHAWLDNDAEMHARVGESQWAQRIEQALDDGRFQLYGQRIEALADGAGSSAHGAGLHAEALLRLVEADGTLVLPGVFMPAAERFHLSSRIDRWVLRQALAWLQPLANDRLNGDGVDLLSVNLSGQSIGDRAFHRHAIDTLQQAGPAVCRRLGFEITETAAVTHLADATVFIEQVRALGVRVALDDFGAGASSFGYLKSLPVDYLKIDGQFVRNLISEPIDAAAVRCFVDVARVGGMRTVAEFVDRPELRARLHDMGVDHAQGFLLHRPAPIDTLLPPLPARH